MVNRTKRPLSLGILAFLFFLVVPDGFGGQSENGANQSVDNDVDHHLINIPSLNAAEALNLLAEQTDALLLFPYDTVKLYSANPVKGKYTIIKALELLLQGSGLSSGLSDKGVVKIYVSNNAPNINEERVVMKKSKKGLLASLIGLFSAVGVQAAVGEEAKVEERQAIEEVLVTAGRRVQSLQDVASSVVAFQPEDFTMKGMDSLEDVIRQTPGLQFQSRGRPGEGTLTARGVPQLGATPVFAYYVDDTPLTSSTSYAFGRGMFLDGLLLDLERVEIVKGPQGTLFGASAVGGMLRYITKAPSLDEVRGSIGVDYKSVTSGGTGNTINGRVSFPIIEDTLGVTLAGYTKDTPGFVDRIDPTSGRKYENDNDGETKAFSADVLFQATDDLSARFKYLKQENDSMFSGEALFVGSTDVGLVGSYAGLSRTEPVTTEFEVKSATINYDFGFAELESVTSIAEFSRTIADDQTAVLQADLDNLFGLAGFPNYSTGTVTVTGESGSERFVQEVRLTSANSDELEWLVGLFYTEEDSENQQQAILTPTPPFPIFFVDFPSEYKEKAIFGALTYYFTDSFDVQIGARYSENEIEVEFSADGFFSTGFAGPLNEINSVEDDVDTYLMKLRYRPSEDHSIYVSIASGYRPATPNLPVFSPATQTLLATGLVESDDTWSYEIGAKGSLADGMLSYDVTLWHLTYDNFQAPFVINGLGTLTNATNGLRATGVESQFTYYPTDRLTLGLNLGYSNSVLKSDEPVFGGVDDANLPGVPIWKVAMQGTYSYDINDEWAGAVNVNARYTGGYPISGALPDESLLTDVSSQLITNVSLSATNDQYSVTLYATNIFNEREITNRLDFDPAAVGGLNLGAGYFEEPRAIGVNVRYDF